ncbi:MAG TPA: hypothetical protein VIZ28_10365 [Chitinophagaceae bacterium]
MKTAVAILAFVLLYLSVQPPMFIASYAAEQSRNPVIEFCPVSRESCATESSCPSEKENIPNPCNQCVCNPLAPCCYYLPTEKVLPYIASRWLQTRQPIPADENILSSYISEFWNPPEPAL